DLCRHLPQAVGDRAELLLRAVDGLANPCEGGLEVDRGVRRSPETPNESASHDHRAKTEGTEGGLVRLCGLESRGTEGRGARRGPCHRGLVTGDEGLEPNADRLISQAGSFLG